MAPLRIANNAVLHSIQGVAGVHDSLMQGLYLFLRQWSVVLHQLQSPLHTGRVQMHVRIGWSAGCDSIEVVRKTRRFNQPLPSARGATVVVGMLRLSAIE